MRQAITNYPDQSRGYRSRSTLGQQEIKVVDTNGKEWERRRMNGDEGEY